MKGGTGMYIANSPNIIYFAVLLMTVYFTGKLAVKQMLDKNSNQITVIVRDAVFEALNITNTDDDKND
jgi:uncharacterized protein YaaW (UPF0174 family)